MEHSIFGLCYYFSKGNLHFSIVTEEIGAWIKNTKELISNSSYNN